MNQEQYLQNLKCPATPVDVVLDTDTYNEIDDQFALAYLICHAEKLRTVGIFAAPFLNQKSTSPADGMKKSYQEIMKILDLMNRPDLKEKVLRGSETYLTDETTPVVSDAAKRMAELAEAYSPEHPLYIVALGAITNVASAILLNPRAMTENTVVVWLGGNAISWSDTNEFNMKQDIAGARVLFGCGVPLIQLPCAGVVSEFRTTRYELEHWLKGKNPVADYLAQNTIQEAESYASGTAWSRCIWDVTAVAWLVNDGGRFMGSYLLPSPIPQYDRHYSHDPRRHLIRYVDRIYRDPLFTDLFRRLAEYGNGGTQT